MNKLAQSPNTARRRTQLGPIDQIADTWHQAPRRWGHPLHSICSYLAMFPPQMASAFIRWLTEPGDAVFDPFSGRGTVALEALLQGRRGYGLDANPLAHALTRAKVRVPSGSSVADRLDELEARYKRLPRISTNSTPADIRMLYSSSTLQQLCFLREELTGRGYVDPFIVALVLGMLHANHSASGATRGFSVSMPNTFAMAPGYVRAYIRDKQLEAPDVDVFAMLRARARIYELPESGVVGGRSWLADATRAAPETLESNRPKLVFTSPPYLQVIKYGKYNWVRLWFLKQKPRSVDQKLMTSSSLDRYLEFMGKVLNQLKAVVDPSGFVCLVIGDVRRGDEQISLANRVLHQVVRPAGWHHHGTVVDAVPAGVKVSRIWKDNPGRATKTDRLLILSPNETELPDVPSIDWTEVPQLCKA